MPLLHLNIIEIYDACLVSHKQSSNTPYSSYSIISDLQSIAPYVAYLDFGSGVHRPYIFQIAARY